MIEKNRCRYADCSEAADNDVCPHNEPYDCDCWITCLVCRESLGLPAIDDPRVS